MDRSDVRPAVLTDARGIAEVHLQAWRETYSRLLPEGALDEWSVERSATRWGETISGGHAVWVAERGGAMVGWASAGNDRGADAPREWELNGIYVLASEYGTGAGQALLDAAVGDRPAFLWVTADNPRAHAFYRRNCFVDDGSRGEHPLAGHPIQIVRFVR